MRRTVGWALFRLTLGVACFEPDVRESFDASSGGVQTSTNVTSSSTGGAATSSDVGTSAPSNDGSCDTSCECAIGDLRSCAAGGWRGTCAAGLQTCNFDGTWSEACSVRPKSKDTCAPGNDDNCNGIVNEGCPCHAGDERSCADGGYVGPCAEGVQVCSAEGVWGDCSIAPAEEDTCEDGNNANCSGLPNEGCLCIEGVTTQICGDCLDGVQTCIDGKRAQFGPCEGAETQVRIYYEDRDGDGYGGAEIRVCGEPPEGAITRGGDCYDENVNAFPGQTEWFVPHRGDGDYDYNCDGVVEYERLAPITIGPASCDGSCENECESQDDEVLTTSPACGTGISYRSCYCAADGVCRSTTTGVPQACR